MVERCPGILNVCIQTNLNKQKNSPVKQVKLCVSILMAIKR